MQGNVFFVLFFLAFMGATTVSGADWKYGDLGSLRWDDNYPDCGDRKQSPINIVPCQAVQDKNLGNIIFTNFDKVPPNTMVNISNSGYLFVVDVSPLNASISGGGLDGSFKAAGFHFHWGKANDGSEHMFNGTRYDGEFHIVHYSSKYADIQTAWVKPGGLAVLGVFLKVGSKNSEFEKVLKYAANVTEATSKVQAAPVPLMNLMPKDLSSFYRYDGSLTTPPCYETVTWTVFKETVEISQAQLDQLKTLKKEDNATLSYNFRPIQPLNERMVKTTFQVSGCPNLSPSRSPSLRSAATKIQAFSGVLTVFCGLLALISFAH